MEPASLFFLVLAAALLGIAVTLRRLGEVERRALRAEAASAQRRGQEGLASAGLLSAELCHAIASPLTVVLGQCELARTLGADGRRLETIERAAREISRVMERYRAVFSKDDVDNRLVDPEQCAREAAESLKEFAKERDVNVHLLLDASPLVPTNAFLLQQGVRQMLKVAIEVSPQGRGNVTLAVGLLPVEGAPTYAAFAVADDGPGVDPDALRSFLRPLSPGGVAPAGVGYAVVDAIARALNGELLLDSSPGEGTRATLKVPLIPVVVSTRAPQFPVTNSAQR